ncbi:MAG: glutamine--fructose-6-phosphate transaminase (isomerizing) [Bacteriovoracaceae bacterium]
MLKRILPQKSQLSATRWATHGGVTDYNAHPHGNEDLVLVHNGIVENAVELKAMLKKEGFEFKSQTDSEVFMVLVTKYFKAGATLFKAVTTAFKLIRGNSAFVVMNKFDDEIIAIKRSAPLVCGENEATKEVFVSSDAYALVGKAKTLYFPQDEIVCRLNPKQAHLVEFFDLEGNPSTKYLKKEQDMSLDVSEKGVFEHFMMKEIHEQPNLIESFTNYYLNGDGLERLENLNDLKPKSFQISACGTAWHAGLVIKNFLESNVRIPCVIDLASEFRYRNPILNKDEVGLFISQSGETADTLAAQELCHENKMKTVSIVNVEGSTLFRNCDINLLIKAGIEIGVASTKAFTQQVLTGYLMSKKLQNQLNDVSVKQELKTLKIRIEEVLERSSEIQAIAKEIYEKKGYLFTGRGKYYPIALEGALKLKEIAYVHAEGYAAGELKHGPIALIDKEMVNVALVGPELFEKTVSNIEEIKARKGIIVTFGPQNDKILEEISDYYFGLNFEGLNDLSPVYINVVNQLLSYYIAKYKGTDIDKPRNLAKSVTVE